MMKKILLLSTILCVPFSVYAADPADGIVIGSSESLTERNLPLDTDVLMQALTQKDAACKENVSFIDFYSDVLTRDFLKGKIQIPFSIQDLYVHCDYFFYERLNVNKEPKPHCFGYCRNFVFTYVQNLVEKSNNQNSSVDDHLYKTDNNTPSTDNKDGIISGTIHGDNGEPLFGCNIGLVSKEGNIIPYYIGSSDNDGRFYAVIKEIYNDVDQIKVLCPGYASQTLLPGENIEIVIKPYELQAVEITATLCDDAALQRLHATNGETMRETGRAFCVPTECVTGYVLINAGTSDAECIKL